MDIETREQTAVLDALECARLPAKNNLCVSVAYTIYKWNINNSMIRGSLPKLLRGSRYANLTSGAGTTVLQETALPFKNTGTSFDVHHYGGINRLADQRTLTTDRHEQYDSKVSHSLLTILGQ